MRGHPTREGHVVDLAVARYLHLEPIRKRVHALGADAMQTPRKLISALPEFSAGMQVGQDQLNCGHLELRMDVHGNAAPVVLDRARTISVKSDIDPRTIPRKMLVDRIVEYLENAMVQTPVVGRADIHPGALADTRKPLQFVNLGSVVLFRISANNSVRRTSRFEEFEHGKRLPLNVGATRGADNRFLNKILPKSTKYRDFT